MKNKDIEYLNLKEFVELGLLQEVNRTFFHPRGLALEISVDENDEYHLNGIWDYRKDQEGVYFDIKNSDVERINRFKQRRKISQKLLDDRKQARLNILGFNIEPIPGYEND